MYALGLPIFMPSELWRMTRRATHAMLSGKGHPQWLWDKLNELHYVERDDLRAQLAKSAVKRLLTTGRGARSRG